MSKIRRRLIPFLFILYIVAYLDRVNLGFAALQMNDALQLSAAVYGFGAGVFFIGYFLFEIPSNLILQRVGARIWIARIMISWGIFSAAMMFTSGPWSFYTLRFLLGLAEAGFFPGMILYLTYWFPAKERAKAVASFGTATAGAYVIGGPVSGSILLMHGAGGLDGWQWLFLLEGLPAILLGFVVLKYLDNGPRDATWLTADERDEVIALLEEERHATPGEHHSLRHALGSGRVWLLAVVYFCVISGFYGVGLWLPQIVKAYSGLGNFLVGLVSAVPFIAASIGMVWLASHSDRTGERRWHIAGSALAGAAGLAISAYSTSPVMSLVALCVATTGIWGTLGPFWALPTAFLRSSAAAAGTALINSIGNLGGFMGPSIVGLAKTPDGSFAGGLVILAMTVAVGAVLVLFVPPSSDEAAGSQS
jgi:ACS family tartrate transporter-like MFS transporter